MSDLFILKIFVGLQFLVVWYLIGFYNKIKQGWGFRQEPLLLTVSFYVAVLIAYFFIGDWLLIRGSSFLIWTVFVVYVVFSQVFVYILKSPIVLLRRFPSGSEERLRKSKEVVGILPSIRIAYILTQLIFLGLFILMRKSKI